MKSLVSVIIFFFTNSCITKDSKNNCINHFVSNPLNDSYISIKGNDSSIICLSFSDLNLVTPYNIIDPKIGSVERAKIACKQKILSNSEKEEILKKNDQPIFFIPRDIEAGNDVDIYLDSCLKKNGIFDINKFNYQKKGVLIKYAIENNYKITFSNYEGIFYWKK
jgi:hypothetical protein